MSQYRFELHKPITRDQKSVVAKAAYNAAERLEDTGTGKVHDYRSKKDNVFFSGIFYDHTRPVPAWINDRATLWNEADAAAGNRKDARLGQEMILNLPWEMTDGQRLSLAKDFVRELVRGTGRVADVSIHRPDKDGDDRNHHVHILLTNRAIGPDGFGEILSAYTPVELKRMRAKWAELGARALERYGFKDEAKDYREQAKSYSDRVREAQRRGDEDTAEACKREPTEHLGAKVMRMERKGRRTRRGDRNREIIAGNRKRLNRSQFVRAGKKSGAISTEAARRRQLDEFRQAFRIMALPRPRYTGGHRERERTQGGIGLKRSTATASHIYKELHRAELKPRTRPISRAELYSYYKRMGMLEAFFQLYPNR